jgi:hypothetical protein
MGEKGWWAGQGATRVGRDVPRDAAGNHLSQVLEQWPRWDTLDDTEAEDNGWWQLWQLELQRLARTNWK